MKLFEKLVSINNEKLVSFHVPGHKQTSLYNEYLDKVNTILDIDTTEIPGTDDLHDPLTCIKTSQDALSKLYKTKESFFLTGGTTCGIYAMIMAVTSPGDTILVARDCHRAVYDGMFLGRLNGIYISPDFYKGIPIGITKENVLKAIKENPQAKALVLTYPNYYGIGTDLKAIEQIVHANNMLLLVDEAHGAHLNLSNELMLSAVDLGADVVVHSSHKSLPSMTQSSVLHLNSDRVNERKLKQMLKLHQSSSPSYVLMSSLDICYDIVAKQGEFLMKKLLGNIKKIRYKYPVFLEQVDLPDGFKLDPTKLTITGNKSGWNPVDIENQLRKNGIQIEFSNENNCVFVSSIMNETGDFEYLSKMMEMLKFKCYSGIDNMEKSFLSKNIMSLSEAYYSSKKMMKLKDAENCISTEYIVPYPPGIPMIIPGELIEEDKLELINRMLDKNQKIVGIDNFEDATIEVVSNEEA
ncbi:MAG: aminotransferase class I/II-fold pyridoxal phosphate-dependent enzyme [Clostridiales bacterium]|nr:aminotransferase class I/II-fold pyridoxal phosphate-dependent enzyme [Clostridiales bacterium]